MAYSEALKVLEKAKLKKINAEKALADMQKEGREKAKEFRKTADKASQWANIKHDVESILTSLGEMAQVLRAALRIESNDINDEADTAFHYLRNVIYSNDEGKWLPQARARGLAVSAVLRAVSNLHQARLGTGL